MRSDLARVVPEHLLLSPERVLETATSGVHVVDSRSSVRALTYVNPAFERITGFAAVEVLGRDPGFLFGPETDPSALAELQKAVDENRACTVMLLCYRKDRSTFWGEESITPAFDEDGRITHFVGVLTDVTERRPAEETLHQRDAVLQAVASSAEVLLRAENWRDVVADVLRELGEAAQVSRSYLFYAHEVDGPVARISQLFEWSARGIHSHANDPDLQNRAPAGTEAEWMAALRDGRIVQGQASESRGPLRQTFESQGIQSMVLVPIHLDNRWWGFLGFDECRRERQWARAEREALRAAAGILAAAIRRREVDHARLEVETRYRTLVEQLPLTTYIDTLDDASPVVYISPQIEPILGYTVEEWLADPGLFERLLHPDDRDEALGGPWPADDGPHRTEYRLIARDGRTVRFLDEYLILRNDEGRRLYTQGYMLDVTESKEIEEELRRANEMLRETTETLETLIAGSPVAIIGIYLDGTVWLWNPAAERTFGWSTVEVIGKPVPFVPSEKQEELRSYLERTRRGESWTGTELRRQRRDGSPIDVSASSAPIRDSRGEIVGMVSVILDVTEQNQLQHQLFQSQRLEAVGRLAGGIAHDFNNLLTAISGYGEFLLEGLDGGDPLRRDVEQIKRAADRAAALVQQLLAFSRRQMLRAEVVDLNAVVVDMETLLRRLIGEDVVLVTLLDADPATVRADPAQIEQIVVNLAVNARDAMPFGGTLQIETATVDDGRVVRLVVADSGIGMDEETRIRAFEPFFTTKEPGKGTGLGLSTVYGIVAQSGGSIELTTEPGRGAAFRIDLPAFAPADG